MAAPAYIAAAESLTLNMDAFLELMADAAPALTLDDAGHPMAHPVNVDRGLYAMLDTLGDLLFVVLRDAAGEVAGAALALVKPHPHHKATLTATVDVFLVQPKAAAAGAGLVLFDALRGELQARGVAQWFMGERLDVPHVLPLMELGRPVEVYWSIPVGNA